MTSKKCKVGELEESRRLENEKGEKVRLEREITYILRQGMITKELVSTFVKIGA